MVTTKHLTGALLCAASLLQPSLASSTFSPTPAPALVPRDPSPMPSPPTSGYANTDVTTVQIPPPTTAPFAGSPAYTSAVSMILSLINPFPGIVPNPAALLPHAPQPAVPVGPPGQIRPPPGAPIPSGLQGRAQAETQPVAAAVPTTFVRSYVPDSATRVANEAN